MDSELSSFTELCGLSHRRGDSWQVAPPPFLGTHCLTLPPSLPLPFSPHSYLIALDTDAKEFDGHARVDAASEYIAMATPWDGRDYSITVYIPCRAGLVLFRAD